MAPCPFNMFYGQFLFASPRFPVRLFRHFLWTGPFLLTPIWPRPEWRGLFSWGLAWGRATTRSPTLLLSRTGGPSHPDCSPAQARPGSETEGVAAVCAKKIKVRSYAEQMFLCTLPPGPQQLGLTANLNIRNSLPEPLFIVANIDSWVGFNYDVPREQNNSLREGLFWDFYHHQTTPFPIFALRDPGKLWQRIFFIAPKFPQCFCGRAPFTF